MLSSGTGAGSHLPAIHACHEPLWAVLHLVLLPRLEDEPIDPAPETALSRAEVARGLVEGY